jgi:hypothetical protein
MLKKKILVYDGPDKKIYLSEDRGTIETIETWPSSTGTISTGTSFSSLNDIRIFENKNMMFETSEDSMLVIEYFLSVLGIKNYIIEKNGLYSSFIKFTDTADYAYFKLKFFKQLRKYKSENQRYAKI